MKKIFSFLTPFIVLLIFVGTALAADTKLDNPLGINISPNDVFARVAGGLVFAAGTLALAFTVFGGFMMLASAGNEEKYGQGKKMVLFAVLGMLLSAGSYTLLSTFIDVLRNGNTKNFLDATILFDPLQSSGPNDLYGKRILGYLMQSLGALTLLVSIYGGTMWMTAAGNEEKIGKAKKTLTYGVVGLSIVFCSYALISFIYNPFYRLLSTGQTPQFNPGSIQNNPQNSDTPVVCFREVQEKINKNGQVVYITLNYGGTCSVEKPSDCVKPINPCFAEKPDKCLEPIGDKYYKGGLVMRNYSNCEQVGACIQKIPGNKFKNRVAQKDCRVEIFPPLASKINKKLECPFMPPLTQTNNGCYAEVEFIPGKDWPLSEEKNQGACLRQEASQAFMTTLNSKCTIETSTACAEPTSDGAYKSGTYYYGFKCEEIGYCKQNVSKFDACKNGVPIGLCGATTFTPVGKPVPPWGCSNIGGDYVEIDSECYVNVDNSNWVAGKVCPPRLR